MKEVKASWRPWQDMPLLPGLSYIAGELPKQLQFRALLKLHGISGGGQEHSLSVWHWQQSLRGGLTVRRGDLGDVLKEREKITKREKNDKPNTDGLHPIVAPGLASNLAMASGSCVKETTH